jgi:2-succinyl-6-hydroxy-2,4-cyclohexadiene-1-carboxylate synthase
MGVERDPGETTAWAIPALAHSSTRVAQKVAWTSADCMTEDGRVTGEGPVTGDGRVTEDGRVTGDGWATEDGRDTETYSQRHPERVVLVHGFTQTGASWGPLASALASRFEVICPDAPGHGAAARQRLDLRAGAAALGELGPASYVGYSMGGRFCLHLAADSPHLVRRLVLISTTAGIDDPGERAQRRAADESLAQRVESEGVASFVDWWLTNPLFAALSSEANALDSRLSNTAAGLASSLRLAGAGTQTPLWDKLGGLDIPVLVVTGENDGRYCRLGERLARSFGPRAVHQVIGGAGHACHLEAPDAFLRLVEPFLAGEPAGAAAQSTKPKDSSTP